MFATSHSTAVIARQFLRASFVLILCTPAAMPCMAQDTSGSEIYKDAGQPVEARLTDLLSRLTPDEKLSLLRGVNFGDTHAIPRLGIPAFKMTDGPVGVRDGKPARVYAGGLSLVSSFDVDMAKKVGVALGRDCRARGYNIILGPAMNFMRSPLNGRNFEYMGEDPLLDGLVASNYVQGVQSQGVAATIKHFVCNDQDFDRDHISSNVDERTLRELYLKPFEMAVKQGGAWCVMDAYNPVNDLHMTENDFLNNQVLKGEWGFKGFVMSDWWALGSTLGEANGGLDLEMPGQSAPMKGHPKNMTPQLLQPLIDSGQVTQATIDDKISRIFRVVFTMGWMDRPQLDSSIPLDDPQNDQVALDGAREGIVLLKNKDNLLPLDPNKVKKIVIIGHNAEIAMAAGGGSGHAQYMHGPSLIQALTDVGGSGVQVIEVPWKGGNNKPYGSDGNPDLPDASTDDIKSADAVIACVGFNDYNVDYWGTAHSRQSAEGEGINRIYDLPDGQAKVIQQLAALNPKTIVVLNAGGGVESASWIDSAQSLIDAFYPGQSEGTAVAEIIFGKTNPSAKLPFSWEKKLEDTPAYGNYPTKETPTANTYSEGVMLGYRYYDTKNIEPLFPFGFGLSYTTFAYSNLAVKAADNGDFTATFTIQNKGPAAGAEVAELYVAPPTAPVERPVHELKGFTRVALDPGESKTVSIPVARKDLAYWDPNAKNWTVTPGKYTVQVGGSSRDLGLQADLTEANSTK
jgi:beta-glucosidase